MDALLQVLAGFPGIQEGACAQGEVFQKCLPHAQEVPNAAWQAHAYISYGDPGKGVRNQILLYGEASSLEDFCNLAQIANYVQYKCAPSSWLILPATDLQLPRQTLAMDSQSSPLPPSP